MDQSPAARFLVEHAQACPLETQRERRVHGDLHHALRVEGHASTRRGDRREKGSPPFGVRAGFVIGVGTPEQLPGEEAGDQREDAEHHEA